MQMTTEARTWLDATVKRILARHALGDAERAGITYELMSHLHAAGEARATAAGRAEVTRDDLVFALAGSGGEEKLGAAFAAPFAKPIERVLLGRRVGAFAIDLVVVLLGLSLTHTVLEVFFRMFAGTTMATTSTPEPDVVFLPWGFHDPTMPLLWQALFTIVSTAVVLGYFAWTEGTMGRTLGKRALDLRVMRVDGEPLTIGDALVRNLSKVSPFVFALDVLAMLIFFAKDKQRVGDKIAKTIVVRA